jgi:DNA-binding transcriptional LysR family regulator
VGLPWEQLRLVLAVARHGTFAGAGRALGMSPATLDAELKRVERAAGAALFVREEGRLLPTDAGRSAMHTGERLAEEMARVDRVLPQVPPGPPVRLSIGETFAAQWLPTAAADLARKLESVTLELVTTRGRKGEIDLEVTATRPAARGDSPRALGTIAEALYAPRPISSTTVDRPTWTGSSGIGWSCSPGRRRAPTQAAGCPVRPGTAPASRSGPTACRCSSPRCTPGWGLAFFLAARRSSRPSWSGSPSFRSCHHARSGSPSAAGGSRPRG